LKGKPRWRRYLREQPYIEGKAPKKKGVQKVFQKKTKDVSPEVG